MDDRDVTTWRTGRATRRRGALTGGLMAMGWASGPHEPPVTYRGADMRRTSK